MSQIDIHNLNDAELEVRIAKVCGWKWKKVPFLLRIIYGKWWTQRPIPRYPEEWLCGYLPPYARDLNAMVEAEEFILSKGTTLWERYCQMVSQITYRDNDWIKEYKIPTCRQKAEAFLVVMSE